MSREITGGGVVQAPAHWLPEILFLIWTPQREIHLPLVKNVFREGDQEKRTQSEYSSCPSTTFSRTHTSSFSQA